MADSTRNLTLSEIGIQGWKSIQHLQPKLLLHRLNVLIGANGAGKSNLVSFFRLLGGLASKSLSQCIEPQGSAPSVLFDGPKTTNTLTWQMTWDVSPHAPEDRTPHEITYQARLGFSPPSALYFASEELEESTADRVQRHPVSDVATPGVQWGRSGLRAAADDGNRAAAQVTGWLESCRVFHFHDTSRTSRIRMPGYIPDNRTLKDDAGNLAAVLLRYLQERPSTYRRIVQTIRQIAPFFEDFDLAPTSPDGTQVLLNWREVSSDLLFGPHQLSDGTLRAMALIALLLQPEDELPSLMIIDEPELGLHPFALNTIAALIQSVSHRCQVIVATQSTALVDRFEPDDVVVVDRDERASSFRRLNADELGEWLEDYSLGELWEKNVIGGGPV